MSGVSSTYTASSTFPYKVYFVYNEGEVDEETLDLSEMLVREPPTIFESYQNNLQKPPNATNGFYGGRTKDMNTVSLSLYVQSNDPQDFELQVREIRDFFDAAPSNAVTVYWVKNSTTHLGKIFSCHLKAISPKRFADQFSQGRRFPVIDLVLETPETSINYTETGDPAPTAPTRYGSTRHRSETNNGSTVWTIVNDVTELTLATFDDTGKLRLRGSMIQEDTSL